VDVREVLAEYNSQAKTDERFVVALQQRHDAISFYANYAALVVLGQSVTKAVDSIRSIGLYNNSMELSKAERSFHDVFTKQFCVEIKSRVDDGIRTLRQMNAELKNLNFGSDSFSIDWSRWEPEFEDYLSFFEAVTKLSDSVEPLDLFGEVALSEKHTRVRDRLVKLLLDEDHERATRELLRIADYRNYRRYDIINDTTSGGRVKLSEWGTGSGGQLETPAYIVRAAVVTNRLKLFEKGASLRLLVNDESFAKMDEPRARAVLGFLRDKLDLQVLSAMPTMKAGALKDEFNREYSFTRLKNVANGELDFISECDERIFKVDKMRELWERQRVLAREKAKQLFDLANPQEDIPALATE
jgi:Putative exonuclease SbcCD, C subunit